MSFSSIGLSSGIADVFGTANYFGSARRGTTWEDILRRPNAIRRAARENRSSWKTLIASIPKMWKKIEDLALGDLALDEYEAEMLALAEMPVAIRHLVGLKTTESDISPKMWTSV
ncbi:MAG: hypothetical protein U0670_15190 [Anaerolineae bacterium]